MRINTDDINKTILFVVSKQHNHAWWWQCEVWLSGNYTYSFIDKWKINNVFLSRLLHNQCQFHHLKWATKILQRVSPFCLFFCPGYSRIIFSFTNWSKQTNFCEGFPHVAWLANNIEQKIWGASCWRSIPRF